MPALLQNALQLLHRYGASLGIVTLVFVGVHLWQTKDFQSSSLPTALADAEFVLLEPNQAPRTVRFNELLAELRAKEPSRPIALYLWAEWCSICKIQESSIQSLSRDHFVITVAVQSGSHPNVARILEDRSLTIRALVDPSGQWLSTLGLRAVPSFMVINEQNELNWVTVGYTTGFGMRARLWLDQAV